MASNIKAQNTRFNPVTIPIGSRKFDNFYAKLDKGGFREIGPFYIRGYCSVNEIVAYNYDGRHGKGYAVVTNNTQSSRYACICYYIK